MFGFKPKTTAPPIEYPPVFGIPEEFYGGANPVVQFKNVEKNFKPGVKNNLTASEQRLFNQSTGAGGVNPMHPANLFTNHKILLAGAVVLFLVFCGGAGWYYWYQLRGVAEKPTAVVLNLPKPIATEPAAEVAVPGPATENVAPTSTEASNTAPANLSEAGIEFPSIMLGDTADLDKDGLTDMAEEIFQTDPAVPDSDGDNYNDGDEVQNLYNPATPTPIKLIDTGLIKDYVNPDFDYRVYYPANWAVAGVDDSARDILFSTLTGENIEIRAFDITPLENFDSWFAVWGKGQNKDDVGVFKSMFNQDGYRRKDLLAYYFVTPDKVYALLYHTTDSNAVNYRSVIKMMAQSFRLSNINFSLPPRVIEERPAVESL